MCILTHGILFPEHSTDMQRKPTMITKLPKYSFGRGCFPGPDSQPPNLPAVPSIKGHIQPEMTKGANILGFYIVHRTGTNRYA